VQDAYATPGDAPSLSTAELDALSGIGYDIAVPEPATWAMMLGSLAAIGLIRRKRAVR